MATITYVDSNVTNGQKVLNALALIRQGIFDLKELDGLRGESISAGQSVMASNFGVNSDANAQALSDRLSAFLAAFDDAGNAEYAKLRDLLNATTYTP